MLYQCTHSRVVGELDVMLHGKRALDAAMLDVGRLVAETLMYMEREERSGPDYHPTSSGLMKWASQRGSIYVGDQITSCSYEQLKNRGGFSEELLSRCFEECLPEYEETVGGPSLRCEPSSFGIWSRPRRNS